MIPVPTELPDEYWVIEKCSTLSVFLKAALAIFQYDFILIIERSEEDKKFAPQLCSLSAQVSRSTTIFGRDGFGQCYEIPVSEQNISVLMRLADEDAPPAICNHVFIVRDNKLCVMWWDPGNSPVYLIASMDECLVKEFASACNSGYAYQFAQRNH